VDPDLLNCKKRLGIFPFPAGMSPTKLSQIKLFPARESLVSDILAGDGKMNNLFLQCRRSGSTILAKEAVQMDLSPAASLQSTVKIKRRH
jgi:hypothetical protein